MGLFYVEFDIGYVRVVILLVGKDGLKFILEVSVLDGWKKVVINVIVNVSMKKML